jgi:hypothetical protein
MGRDIVLHGSTHAGSPPVRGSGMGRQRGCEKRSEKCRGLSLEPRDQAHGTTILHGRWYPMRMSLDLADCSRRWIRSPSSEGMAPPGSHQRGSAGRSTTAT